MNLQHQSVDYLDAEEASRLAVKATAADLEFWAGSVAIRGPVSLTELLGVLDALRAVSVSDAAVSSADRPALAALIAS